VVRIGRPLSIFPDSSLGSGRNYASIVFFYNIYIIYIFIRFSPYAIVTNKKSLYISSCLLLSDDKHHHLVWAKIILIPLYEMPRLVFFIGGNEMEQEDDFLLDEVSGRKRKPIMSLLNKTKLSTYEMDELFCDEV
jgi:hypothetical protein